MTKTNPRDRSRTCHSKSRKMVYANTKPPSDQNGWQWLTVDLMISPAYRTLTGNASKAFSRILIEHVSHGALENGRLIVTHHQFMEYGVTGEYVADAIDELEFKGLIRIQRGRAGAGTSHPNLYRLTFTGNWEGAKASNEWMRCTMDTAKAWSDTVRKQMAEARSLVGRKKIPPLRKSEMRPLRTSEIREAS